jgi:hypothetical protein
MFLNGKLNQLRITLKDTTEDKSYDEETAADELAYKEGITIDTTTSNKTGSGNIKKKSKTSKKK